VEKQDSAQERTQQPTPKRRADAAKRGMVLRSRELNTMIVTLGGAITIYLGGSLTIQQLRAFFVDAIGLARPTSADSETVMLAMGMAREDALTLGLPILAIFALLALLGPLLTGGIAFRSSNLAPKFEKLNPLSGVKRMFSAQSLLELFKALLKFSMLLATAVALYYWTGRSLLLLGDQSVLIGLGQAGKILSWSFVVLSSALVVIAAIDLPFQAMQHLKKLRMTHQEVRDEMKETEGRPEVKRRQRQLQMQAARRRIESEVPTATVVITNPTHYAVALRYEDGHSAPVVAVRGAGELAWQIRRLARQHQIPEVTAPPLARALYFGVSEAQPIPSELYRAVAQVLVYVLQLNDRRKRMVPPVIRDTDIPPHLRREPD